MPRGPAGRSARREGGFPASSLARLPVRESRHRGPHFTVRPTRRASAEFMRLGRPAARDVPKRSRISLTSHHAKYAAVQQPGFRDRLAASVSAFWPERPERPERPEDLPNSCGSRVIARPLSAPSSCCSKRRSLSPTEARPALIPPLRPLVVGSIRTRPTNPIKPCGGLPFWCAGPTVRCHALLLE